MTERTQFIDVIKKPLAHFLDHGVAVIPTLPSGATVGSWKDPANFTTDRDVVTRHWTAGIRRFQFLPEAAGFLCFDIDRKNGKDGLLELYRIFNTAELAMPSYLVDVETFPSLTVTPSGGLHLYFRYAGESRYRSTEIAPGLEAVHYNHLLTVPGSRKEEGEYQFYGDLRQAPELPPVMQQFLAERAEPEKVSRPVWTYNQKTHGKLSLEEIAGVIDRQGQYSPEASRNRYSYEVAKYAKKQGYGPEELEAYLQERFEAEDFPLAEIRRTIESAFRG